MEEPPCRFRTYECMSGASEAGGFGDGGEGEEQLHRSNSSEQTSKRRNWIPGGVPLFIWAASFLMEYVWLRQGTRFETASLAGQSLKGIRFA